MPDNGVEGEHYDMVGEALLYTLGQGLGEGFAPEVESAWTTAYTALATLMKEAAANAVLKTMVAPKRKGLFGFFFGKKKHV